MEKVPKNKTMEASAGSGEFYVIADPETGVLLSFCNARRVTGRFYRAARFLSRKEAENVLKIFREWGYNVLPNAIPMNYAEYTTRGFNKQGVDNPPQEAGTPEQCFLLKHKGAFLFFSRANKKRVTQQPVSADLFLTEQEAKATKKQYDLSDYSIELHKHYLKRTAGDSRRETQRNFLLQDRETLHFISMSNISRKTSDLKKAALFGSEEEAYQAAQLMGLQNIKIVRRDGEQDIDFPKETPSRNIGNIDPYKYFLIFLENGDVRSYNKETFFGRSAQTMETGIARNADIFLSKKMAEETINMYDLRSRYRTATPIAFAEAVNLNFGSRQGSEEEYIFQDRKSDGFFTFATPARVTKAKTRASVFLSDKERDDVLGWLQSPEGGGWDLRVLRPGEKPNRPNIQVEDIRSEKNQRNLWWLISFQEGEKFFARSKKGRRCSFSYEADVFETPQEAEDVINYYELQQAKVQQVCEITKPKTMGQQTKKKATTKGQDSYKMKEDVTLGKLYYVLQYKEDYLFYTLSNLQRATDDLYRAICFDTYEQAKKYAEEFFLEDTDIVQVDTNRPLRTPKKPMDSLQEQGDMYRLQYKGGQNYLSHATFGRLTQDPENADCFLVREDAEDALEELKEIEENIDIDPNDFQVEQVTTT